MSSAKRKKWFLDTYFGTNFRPFDMHPQIPNPIVYLTSITYKNIFDYTFIPLHSMIKITCIEFIVKLHWRGAIDRKMRRDS